MIPKINYPNFTINIASKPKTIRKSTKRVSRKCYAVVVKDGNTFKARVALNNDETPEYLLLPFTEESFSLRGKEYVYTVKNYEHNRPILVIRSYADSLKKPGLVTQYTPFKEGILIAGIIIENKNVKEFSYEDFVASTEGGTHINPVLVHEDKPLFNK